MLGILPEVTTVGEAISLASREFNLTATEAQELRRLLQKEVAQLA
jgi:hypothetical protein